EAVAAGREALGCGALAPPTLARSPAQIRPRQTEPHTLPRLRGRRALAEPLLDHGLGDLVFVMPVLGLQFPLVRLIAAVDRSRAGIHQLVDAAANEIDERRTFQPETVAATRDDFPHADR